MVNRYETLKSIQNINRLYLLGILQMHIMDWVVIYEYYLIERQTNKKLQSYSNTAENYRLSERHVMNIVFWMEGC
jgi:hypothetical protein